MSVQGWGRIYPVWETILSLEAMGGHGGWASLLTVCTKRPLCRQLSRRARQALQPVPLMAALGQLMASRGHERGSCGTPRPQLAARGQDVGCEALHAVLPPSHCGGPAGPCLFLLTSPRAPLSPPHTDCAVLAQAWPLQGTVAAAGQLHPLEGHLPLHPHLWHVLRLSIVSTAWSWRPRGGWGNDAGRGAFTCFL